LRKSGDRCDPLNIDNGFSEHRSITFKVDAYECAHPDLIGKYASNDAFLENGANGQKVGRI
jgi:hypothetical protein